MLNKIYCILTISFLTLFVINQPMAVYADEKALAQEAEEVGNFREALNHYIKALEADGTNTELRKKLVIVAAKLDPPPAVPQEAKKHLARGRAAVKMASDQEGFMKASEEFAAVIQIAPWLAEAYYNLGVVQDKAGEYSKAIANLEMYLLASPQAQDTEEVQDLIYEIEFRMENVADLRIKEAEKEAEKEEGNRNQLLRNLVGKWNENTEYVDHYYTIALTQDSSFKATYNYTTCKATPNCGAVPILRSLEATLSNDYNFLGKAQMRADVICTYNESFPVDGQISDDGNSLTLSVQWKELDWDRCRWTEKSEILTTTWTKY